MGLRDWQLRARALFRPWRTERDLHDELSFHIERETRKLIDQGETPAAARLKAHARFGSVTVTADACRDERGIAFVDNTIGDLVYAWRSVARAPLASFTIVTTVALGLALVTVLFSILNVFLFRVDNVPGLEELFAVERPEHGDGERPRFTRAQFEALRRDTQVFADAYAELAEIDTRIEGRMMSGTMVSGNFFAVVRMNARLGRTLIAADDGRFAGQAVIVLSDPGWKRRFGSDPNVIGTRVTVNGAPHEIVGVMPEGFRGLAVSAPDYWAPLAMLAEHRPMHRGREGQVGLDIVGRLRPGISVDVARAQLSAWQSQQAPAGTKDGAPTTINLVPRRGTVTQPLEALVVFTPLFFTFGLVLMIGCANVANLLLARAISRQKEIGVRLSLGASRLRIVRQLLTESLLLALAAAAAGYVMSRWAMNAIITAVLTSAPPDLGDISLTAPDADWRVVMFAVAAAVVATGFFGLLPAVQATRIEPVRTLRGEVVRDVRPGHARTVLIATQVAASALLLICSAVFLRSAVASATVDPGMRTADTIVIDVANEPTRTAMVRAVLSDPVVMAAAAAWPGVTDRPRAAFAQAGGVKANVAYTFVSPEYFGVLDIPVVRGRGFTPAEAAGAIPVVIVSERTARTLWADAEPIGQSLQLEPDPDSSRRRIDEPPLPSRVFTVIGVARDVVGFRLVDFEETGIYVPVTAATAKTSLVARVHGDPELARRHLLDRLTLVDPNMGQVLTMRTMARMETYFLQIGFWVSLVLGGLALALTVSGLFSVLSYLVEQRTREIGVRMALGATSRSVTRLVMTQTVRPVGFGLVAGGGLAAALATLLVSMPGAAPVADIVHVLDPVAYAASLLFIIVACLLAASVPAARASRVDPMRTLRQE